MSIKTTRFVVLAVSLSFLALFTNEIVKREKIIKPPRKLCAHLISLHFGGEQTNQALDTSRDRIIDIFSKRYFAFQISASDIHPGRGNDSLHIRYIGDCGKTEQTRLTVKQDLYGNIPGIVGVGSSSQYFYPAFQGPPTYRNGDIDRPKMLPKDQRTAG